MSGPCPCWLDNYNHPSDVHCCFRGVALEDCRLGEAPPCGHWHPDVPMPGGQLEMFPDQPAVLGVKRYQEGGQ